MPSFHRWSLTTECPPLLTRCSVLAGMHQVPAMPTYQPAYQQMEAAMPAAPLPPQAVKRPLTISAPDDGSQQQAMMHGYAAGYAGEGSGEALPQRTAAGAGGRRYSAVARQGM